MTTKLTIKIAVFRCDLTLVAKYVFSQALSHLEIRLAGSEGDSTTGPTGARSTRLNCIVQDLSRDTTVDHIWRAQLCATNAGIFGNVYEKLSIYDYDYDCLIFLNTL